MHLNLRVLSLEIVQNLVPQKCLLPKSVFHKNRLKPGAWMKCVLSPSNDDGSICQIFPRDMNENYCYLDNCVTIVIGKAVVEKADQMLVELCPLQETTTAVTSVQIIIVITEGLFSNHAKAPTLAALSYAVQLLLQCLSLTVGSVVHMEELKKLGIAHVKIIAAELVGGENVYFNITDETTINIMDVQLYAGEIVDIAGFDLVGCEAAYAELQQILELANMQKRINFSPSLNGLLVGAVGCGKSSLAALFIKQNSCNCFRISTANVLGQYPGETEAELRKIFNAAHYLTEQLKTKSPTIILIEDLHLLCPTVRNNTSADAGNSMRICAQLLTLIDNLYKNSCNIICLATTSMPENLSELMRRPGRFEREIIIDVPTAEKRKDIFQMLSRKSSISARFTNALTLELLDVIAKQTQGYVIADLALLLRTVEQQYLREDCTDFDAVIRNCLKQSKPISLRGTDVTIHKTEHGFDSIGGMQDLKRTIEVSILAGLKQQQAFRRFGLNLPKGILLYGPPGCAKTTFAKCLAHEANMTFIATSGAEVYSPYVGCAEKFIVKIFDTARRNTPCLIFLDEIDTLVGSRAHVASHSFASDVQVRILSTLLTEMDGIIATSRKSTTLHEANDKHILVVAATNRPDMIDDALLRPGRFDRLIHVPTPDLESRLSLLELLAKRMPFAYDVRLNDIAERTVNYSGADICNLCNEAALLALQDDFNAEKIQAKQFEHILHTQKSSLTQAQIDWYLDFEQRFQR